MKRWIFGSFLMILVLALLLGWWGWRQWTGPGPSVEGNSGPVLLDIPQGMTLSAAADTLVSRGLLRYRSIILLGARATGQDRGLRAGLYRLPRGGSARDLLKNLTTGQTVQVRLTIAEGLDAPEVARIMSQALEFSVGEFLAAADSLVRSKALSGALLNGDDAKAEMKVTELDSIMSLASRQVSRQFHWCEGYLAPDTYLFSAGTGAVKAAEHLVDTQMARLDSALVLCFGKATVFESPHQLLTLASIVEAEARHQDERPLISAVYSNRLRRNWRLEADPTVAYILEKRGKRMFYRDLEVDSPYNAYRLRGLPPGPIGNPGLASLLAAAVPDSTCDAMYFVSDGEGGHVFSRTAREHEEAVQRYRKSKAAERRRNKS